MFTPLAERRCIDSFRPRYSCVPTAAWLSRLLINRADAGFSPDTDRTRRWFRLAFVVQTGYATPWIVQGPSPR